MKYAYLKNCLGHMIGVCLVSKFHIGQKSILEAITLFTRMVSLLNTGKTKYCRENVI